jgi:hypothetical protein
LSHGDRLDVEDLLLLDGGDGMGLNLGIQLLGTLHQLLGLDVELADGDLLFCKQGRFLVQPLLHHRLQLLGGGLVLQHGAPC